MAKNGIPRASGGDPHPVDRDPVCGYQGIIEDVCPGCGRVEEGAPFERIRRITGYLVGSLDILFMRLYYALIYLVFLAVPIFLIIPLFNIIARVASTVVGLTSGKTKQISCFEIGRLLPSTVASILLFFVTFWLFTIENLLSSSL